MKMMKEVTDSHCTKMEKFLKKDTHNHQTLNGTTLEKLFKKEPKLNLWMTVQARVIVFKESLVIAG